MKTFASLVTDQATCARQLRSSRNACTNQCDDFNYLSCIEQCSEQYRRDLDECERKRQTNQGEFCELNFFFINKINFSDLQQVLK